MTNRAVQAALRLPTSRLFDDLAFAAANACLVCDLEDKREAQRSGTLCYSRNQRINETDPGVEPFHESGSVEINGGASGNILTYTTEPGMIAIISELYFGFTDAAFVPGSGTVLWSLYIGQVVAPGYGNMSIPMGLPNDGWVTGPKGLFVPQNSLIAFAYTATGGTGRINAGIKGYRKSS